MNNGSNGDAGILSRRAAWGEALNLEHEKECLFVKLLPK